MRTASLTWQWLWVGRTEEKWQLPVDRLWGRGGMARKYTVVTVWRQQQSGLSCEWKAQINQYFRVLFRGHKTAWMILIPYLNVVARLSKWWTLLALSLPYVIAQNKDSFNRFIVFDNWKCHNTVELHLSELNGMTSHHDMQKIRIIGFFFQNRLHWQFEVGKKNLQTAVLDYIFIYVHIKH